MGNITNNETICTRMPFNSSKAQKLKKCTQSSISAAKHVKKYNNHNNSVIEMFTSTTSDNVLTFEWVL